MIYRKQKDFDNFKCIADKCPKSCCIGWQIMIDEDSLDTESVNFGCTVHFEDMETKQEYTYRLSGSTESNILEGSISNESPVGSKLIGSKVGQVITIDAPDGGKYSYKILDFTRN